VTWRGLRLAGGVAGVARQDSADDRRLDRAGPDPAGGQPRTSQDVRAEHLVKNPQCAAGQVGGQRARREQDRARDVVGQPSPSEWHSHQDTRPPLATLISSVTSRPCVLAGHGWGGILVQLLAFRRPELVAALVLVDPAHEDAAAILPGLARWLLRQAPKLKALTGRPDELAGAAASRPLLRQLRAAARPFPDVPVIVISATRGFPRSMRAHWTKLQASLAGSAAQGRHITADGSGHAVHQQQPQLVAKTILKATAAAEHAGPGPN
jgi:hypothetical protein